MPETLTAHVPVEQRALDALVQGRNGDPFSLLGRHPTKGGAVIRAFMPGALAVSVLSRKTGETLGELPRIHNAGVFSGTIARDEPYRLRIQWSEAVQETEDPYSFGLLLSDDDLHKFSAGTHPDPANCLGALPRTIDGIPGVRFAVWAPNARRVSVVGDFNAWDGRRHPMRLRHGAGIWELFIPRLGVGEPYKYEIVGPDMSVLPLKADPFARATEVPPATASIVAGVAPYRWTDEDWMANRAARQRPDAPISVYEVHAASWFRDEAHQSPSWDVLADRLVPYV